MTEFRFADAFWNIASRLRRQYKAYSQRTALADRSPTVPSIAFANRPFGDLKMSAASSIRCRMEGVVSEASRRRAATLRIA